MKTKFKNILALLVLTLFSLTVNSQVYNHNTRVKISTVNQLMSLDGNTKLVIHDSSNNELKYVTASQLQSIISNLEGYNETGTRSGGDLIVTLGDYDDTNNGIKIQLDDANETISFLSTDRLNFSNNLRVENQGTGFYGTLNMGSILSDQNYFFPNNSGTIALTSDIITPTLNQVLTSGNIGTQDLIIDGNRNDIIVRDLVANYTTTLGSTGLNVRNSTTQEYVSVLTDKIVFFDGTNKTGSLSSEALTNLLTEWKLPAESGTLAIETKNTGVFDYNDTATTTTPITITGSGSADLTNNELGASTNKLYPPTGVTDIWDASTNRFDFTELPLGSIVQLRTDITVTTNSANQFVELVIDLGLGASPYSLSIDREQYKNSGTYRYTATTFVYMGDLNTRDNPAKLSVTTDGTLNIVVNGWACNVIKY